MFDSYGIRAGFQILFIGINNHPLVYFDNVASAQNFNGVFAMEVDYLKAQS